MVVARVIGPWLGRKQEGGHHLSMDDEQLRNVWGLRCEMFRYTRPGRPTLMLPVTLWLHHHSFPLYNLDTLEIK